MGSLGYFNIFVTYVEKHGNFLRLYGHLDHTSAKTVERLLQQQFEFWEAGNCLAVPGSVHVDSLCTARYSDGAYYRARVLAVEPGFASVVFIDFGNRERLPLTDLRVPDAKEANSIFRIPAQASPFILSGVIGTWSPRILDEVMAKIGYEEVRAFVIKNIGDSINLLKLYHENRDYCDTLQSQGYASVVPQEYFEALVMTTLAHPAPAPMAAPVHAPMGIPGYTVHPMQQSLLVEQMGMWPMWQRMGAAGLAPTVPAPALTLSVPISMAPTMTTVPAGGMAVTPSVVTPSPLRSVPSSQDMRKKAPLTRFNALILDNNTEHKVFVSHVEKGTFSFAVQLSANEKSLETLVHKLNSPTASFSRLELPFLPGTTCLAKYSEDDTIYRAVITNAESDRCQVYFVDYGNTDAVKCQDLFEIPAEYSHLQAMAVQFTLAGMGNAHTTEETRQLFYDLVLEKDAILQVLPTKSEAKQVGELFIDDTNIKELINMEALKNRRKKTPKLEFKNVQLPESGSKVKVVVAFVKSFSQFYVQLAANSTSLETIMSHVNEYCNGSAEPLQESDVQPGAPCCALYDGDGQYYRAILLNCDLQDLSVMYVDYGNVEKVALTHLKSANSAIVDNLRTQAIPCALKGFENQVDDQLLSKFENLVLEKTFIMHVVKLDTSLPQLIVRLCDSDGTDVGQMLAPAPSVSEAHVHNAERVNGWDSSADSRGAQSAGRKDFASSQSRDLSQDSERLREPRRNSGKDFTSNSSTANSWGERSIPKDHGGKSRESVEGSSGSQRCQSKTDPEVWGIGKGGRGIGHCDRTEVEGRYDSKVPHRRLDEPSKSTYRPHSKPEMKSEVIVKSIAESPSLQGSDVPVVISWFESPGRFYCQLKSTQSEFERRMMELQSDYECRTPLSSPCVGEAVVARFKEDNGFYRGVIKIQKGEKFGVQYIDYGNKALLESNHIYGLLQQYSVFPAHAVPCQLEGVMPPGEKWMKSSALAEYFQTGEFTLNFHDTTPECCTVSMKRNGIDVAADLISKNLASSAQQRPDVNLAVGSSLPADLSFIKSANEFYVHLQSESEKLEEMQGQLQAASNSMEPLSALPEPGAKIMALYSEDSVWYRGQVLPGGRVLFIDYGNDEDVTLENMRKLPEELTLIKAMALKCSLASPNNMTWPSSVMDKLIPELESGPFTVVVKVIKDDLFTVDVINAAGCSIGTTLAEEGFVCVQEEVQDVRFAVGSSLPADLSFIKSPNEFYVHLQSESEKLEEVQGQLQAASNTMVPLSALPEPGAKIMALYSEDSVWYRGQVLPDGKVLFIDYGNDEVVTLENMRELPEELTHVEAMALKCSLAAPNNMTWPVSVMDKLVSELESGPFTLVVKVIHDDLFTVDVINAAGCSIGTALGEEGFVCVQEKVQDARFAVGSSLPADLSFIKSPNEFYVHLQSESEKLEEMQGQLQAASNSMEPLLALPEPGAKIMALYSEDSVWYRGQVLPGGRVLFIDYGNDEDVNLENMRELPQELTHVEAMALKCSLAAPNNVTWPPSVMDKLVSELESGPFTVVVKLVQDHLLTVDVLNAAGCSIGTTLAGQDLARVLEEVETMNLAVGSKLSADLSFIKSANEFYVHPETLSKKLEKMQEDLQAVSHCMRPLSSLPEPGDKIMALYSEDSVWYRGQVLLGGRVLFIDYGNDEDVTLENMRNLPPEFSRVNPLALKCSLACPHNMTWSPSVMDKLVPELESGLFTIVIKAVQDDLFTVDVINAAGCSTGTALAEEGFVCVQEEVQDVRFAVGSSLPADLSFIKSPHEFYVHLQSESEKLEDMQGQLQAASNSMEPLSALPEPGAKIMALFSEDSVWYRGQVLPNGRVLFIDYGNDEDVTLENMRKLPEELSGVKAMALKCSLASPNNMTWPPSVMDRLVPELEVGSFTVLLKAMEGEDFSVDVINAAGCSIGTALAQEGFLQDNGGLGESVALRSPGEKSKALEASVVYAKSPAEFYIHLSTDESEIEKMAADLSSAEQFPEISAADVKPGLKCAVLYDEDSVWYRAKVLKNEDNILVKFIDYGNEAVATSIRALPDHLEQVHPLALHCTLPAPNGGVWNECATEKFDKLINSEDNFQVELLSSVEPFITNLIHSGGEGMYQELASMCGKEKLEVDQELVDLRESLKSPSSSRDFRSLTPTLVRGIIHAPAVEPDHPIPAKDENTSSSISILHDVSDLSRTLTNPLNLHGISHPEKVGEITTVSEADSCTSQDVTEGSVTEITTDAQNLDDSVVILEREVAIITIDEDSEVFDNSCETVPTDDISHRLLEDEIEQATSGDKSLENVGNELQYNGTVLSIIEEEVEDDACVEKNAVEKEKTEGTKLVVCLHTFNNVNSLDSNDVDGIGIYQGQSTATTEDFTEFRNCSPGSKLYFFEDCQRHKDFVEIRTTRE